MVKTPRKFQMQLQVFRHPNLRTVPERLDLLRGVNSNLESHASYRECQTDPSREHLKTCELELSNVQLAVQAGNRTMIPQRNLVVERVDEALYDFVHFVEKKGRKEPEALHNIGLDSLFITQSKKSAVVAPGSSPFLFEVVNGNHLGQMLGSVGVLPGVRSWEMWLNAGDPNDESAWRFYKTYFKTTGMVIAGLESGRVYYFRIRGLNSAGASPWSAVVSLRAL
ncbi:fibronectin type III domain-containing protein [Geomonas sp. Red32]|uniref:fibronectin type III domain-containing protein n=1 Tax=Geomonas sp. Red32 TaxID=2912856 RepID=UPI00202D07F3|nr:fibronectin type III domain-containing protein [Geomonas sp. Red32]MCM0080231.1 fibronectin type III domain-containing protein [Geomonas sp. Red32]